MADIAVHLSNSDVGLTLPPHKCPSLIAIFEDGLDQLAILAGIEPDVSKTDNRPLGEEITRILKHQKSLEYRYNELVQEQEILKKTENKTKYKESKYQVRDIQQEISASANKLSKNLKTHPNVASNLLKIQNERSNLQALMSKICRELKESKMTSLNMMVVEENRKRNTLQNTVNRESEANQLLKQIQRDLGNEKKLLEEECQERNNVIQQIKDTIQEINALTTSEQRYIKKETKAHENSVKQKCVTTENQLIATRDKILLDMHLETKANAHIVKYLNYERELLESKIQEWMGKYEEDTEKKQTELENIKSRRSVDLEKFENLVVAYEELEKIVEEDRLLKLKLAEEARIEKLKLAEKASKKKGKGKGKDKGGKDKGKEKGGKDKAKKKK